MIEMIERLVPSLRTIEKLNDVTLKQAFDCILVIVSRTITVRLTKLAADVRSSHTTGQLLKST
jgi:hypothetical protein